MIQVGVVVLPHETIHQLEFLSSCVSTILKGIFLIFMVKDFTNFKFSVFNCRKNIINKRSNSLMPLWLSTGKDKEMKKRGKEGSEPLLLKYLSPHSLSYGFQAKSSIPFKVYLNRVCVEGGNKRERNVEGNKVLWFDYLSSHQHFFFLKFQFPV